MLDSQEDREDKSTYKPKENEPKIERPERRKVVPKHPAFLTRMILKDGLLQVFAFLVNSLSLLLIYTISIVSEMYLLKLAFGSLDIELIESHPLTKQIYFWLQMLAAAIGIISYLIHLVIGAIALAKIEFRSIHDE